MTQRRSGFTLIELMIAVSVVGILAAIALPAYNDYVSRARIAEAFGLTGAAQHGVAEYHERWGRLPQDNTMAGLPRPDATRGAAVASLTVTNGVIEVRFEWPGIGSDIAGKTLYLRPAVNRAYPTAPLVWVCGDRAAPEGFEVVGQIGAAAVPNKYLPGGCR